MLTKVTSLPRENRWDAMARGALRDDLYAVLDVLTRSVLEVSEPGSPAAGRLAQWSDINADSLERAQAALGGIERMSYAGIAALSVALRTLRTVTKPASSTVGEVSRTPAAVQSPDDRPAARSRASTRTPATKTSGRTAKSQTSRPTKAAAKRAGSAQAAAASTSVGAKAKSAKSAAQPRPPRGKSSRSAS